MLVATHELDVDSGSEQVYEIPLTRGYKALVSERDFRRISRFTWHANVGAQVRAARCSMRRMIYMQHEVLEIMPWDLNGLEVDHIDGNSLNNRRSNLQIVTHAENMRKSKNAGTSIGVSYNYRAKLWIAYLSIPGHKRRYLGYRKTREEALALVEAARCS